MKWKHPKSNTNKNPEEIGIKSPKVGEMKKCNQQWKHSKTIVKINGEETVMKSPKGFF